MLSEDARCAETRAADVVRRDDLLGAEEAGTSSRASNQRSHPRGLAGRDLATWEHRLDRGTTALAMPGLCYSRISRPRGRKLGTAGRAAAIEQAAADTRMGPRRSCTCCPPALKDGASLSPVRTHRGAQRTLARRGRGYLSTRRFDVSPHRKTTRAR